MRRFRLFALALASVAFTACQDVPTASPVDDTVDPSLAIQSQEAERVMAGRVLARLVDGANAAEVARAHGLEVEREPRGRRPAILRGAAGNERSLAARLGGDDRVVYAEPDYLRQTTAIDPRMWAFYNPGELSVQYTRGRNKGNPVPSLLSAQDADVDNVEGYAEGGASVSIASLDSGVDMDHPEFAAATVVAGWDHYDNDADPSDTDDHGTHTGGTMIGDNVGVAGVSGAAPNVTLYV